MCQDRADATRRALNRQPHLPCLGAMALHRARAFGVKVYTNFQDNGPLGGRIAPGTRQGDL